MLLFEACESLKWEKKTPNTNSTTRRRLITPFSSALSPSLRWQSLGERIGADSCQSWVDTARERDRYPASQSRWQKYHGAILSPKRRSGNLLHHQSRQNVFNGRMQPQTEILKTCSADKKIGHPVKRWWWCWKDAIYRFFFFLKKESLILLRSDCAWPTTWHVFLRNMVKLSLQPRPSVLKPRRYSSVNGFNPFSLHSGSGFCQECEIYLPNIF